MHPTIHTRRRIKENPPYGPTALQLEVEADAAGCEMVGGPAEAGGPRAGRSMRGVHGGAKDLVRVADIQIAVLAKQVSAAVAEGEARTGLGLCRKGPGGGVGARVEVVDAGLRRVGLDGRGALDGDVGGADAAAEIGRDARIKRGEADHHVRQEHRGAGRERRVEGLFYKPRRWVQQRRTRLVAREMETFDLQSGPQMRAIRPFITEMRARETDAAAARSSRGIDRHRTSGNLGKKDGAELAEGAAAAAAPATEDADIGAAAGRRKHGGPLAVHRIGLRGRRGHRLLRGLASGRPGCRCRLAGLSRCCGAALPFRLLQFGAQFGNGLLLRLQHAKQFGIGWNVLGMRGGARRHQARGHDETLARCHLISRPMAANQLRSLWKPVGKAQGPSRPCKHGLQACFINRLV